MCGQDFRKPNTAVGYLLSCWQSIKNMRADDLFPQLWKCMYWLLIFLDKNYCFLARWAGEPKKKSKVFILDAKFKPAAEKVKNRVLSCNQM
jgi:hypothetical protein